MVAFRKDKKANFEKDTTAKVSSIAGSLSIDSMVEPTTSYWLFINY